MQNAVVLGGDNHLRMNVDDGIEEAIAKIIYGGGEEEFVENGWTPLPQCRWRKYCDGVAYEVRVTERGIIALCDDAPISDQVFDRVAHAIQALEDIRCAAKECTEKDLFGGGKIRETDQAEYRPRGDEEVRVQADQQEACQPGRPQPVRSQLARCSGVCVDASAAYGPRYGVVTNPGVRM